MDNHTKIKKIKKILNQYQTNNQIPIVDNKPKSLEILKKICNHFELVPKQNISQLENDVSLSKQDEMWKETFGKLNYEFIPEVHKIYGIKN